MNTFTTLLVCHLIGDFLFQNHWMVRKSQSSFVCTVHIAAYSFPFWMCGDLFWLDGLQFWLVVIILMQHWHQDRFSMHLRWMRVYGQSSVNDWPVGPLCVDQAMHIAFMGLATLASEGMS